MKDTRGASLKDGDLSPGVGTFLRGLSLGAFVGAAIAGSALLQRRRRSETPRSSDSTHARPTGDVREPPPG